MYICRSCGKEIEKYEDIDQKIIDINGYDYIQETCPHCDGDIRGSHEVL